MAIIRHLAGLLWLPLAIIDLVVSFLAYPLAPFIAGLSMLPGSLARLYYIGWLWLTDDNPIDGDGGHLARWAALVAAHPFWGVYCRRVGWLWRNKAYNFSTYVTGLPVNGATRFWGNRSVSDNPLSAGWCFAWNRGLWELYLMWPWWSSAKRGLRIRIGWSLPMTDDVASGRQMLKTSINPVMGYVTS